MPWAKEAVGRGRRAVRQEYLTGQPPTSTTVDVSKLFLPGALLEVEITAAVTDRADLE